MKRILLVLCVFAIYLSLDAGQPANVSAQGQLTATPGNYVPLEVHTIQRLKITHTISRGKAYQAAWIDNGQRLAVASATGVWSYDTFNLDAPPRLLSDHADVLRIAVSADGKRLVWLGANDAYLVDAFTGQLIASIAQPSGPQADRMVDVAISADGVTFATNDTMLDLLTMNTATGVQNRGVTNLGKFVLNHDGTLIAYIDEIDGEAQIAGTDREYLLPDAVPEFPNRHASDIAFSPAENIAAIGYQDGTIWLVNPGTLTRIAMLEQNTVPITVIGFDTTGNLLASGHKDGSVRVWDVYARQNVLAISGIGLPVEQIGFSPNSGFIAAQVADNVVLWDVITGKSHVILREATQFVFHPSGTTTAAIYGSTVNLWDVSSGQLIGTVPSHNGEVNQVAFSPDSQWIAIVNDDNTITVKSAETGEDRIVLEGHSIKTTDVVFGPFADMLASSGADGTLTFWNVETGKRRLWWRTDGAVKSIAFSSDNSEFAAAHEQGLTIWDVMTGKERSIASGSFILVEFHPTEKLIAALDSTGKVHQWNSADGKLLYSFDSFILYIFLFV
jgi:WD40 repeat protein